MTVDRNLIKRVKAIQNIDKHLSQLVYFRDNRDVIKSMIPIAIWDKNDVHTAE